jgi:hypothetical protein
MQKHPARLVSRRPGQHTPGARTGPAGTHGDTKMTHKQRAAALAGPKPLQPGARP